MLEGLRRRDKAINGQRKTERGQTNAPNERAVAAAHPVGRQRGVDDGHWKHPVEYVMKKRGNEMDEGYRRSDLSGICSRHDRCRLLIVET